MNEFTEYAPIIIIILIFLVQQRIIVTPEQLEKKHREIIEETDEKLTNALKTKASVEKVEAMASELTEIKGKLNDIYEILMDRKKNA